MPIAPSFTSTASIATGTYEREVHVGPTGSIHHIALNCAGFDDMIARLEARGMEYKLNTVHAIGLRQIFTRTRTTCCWSSISSATERR